MRSWLRTHRAFLIVLGVGFALRLGWLLYARPTPVSDWYAYRQLAADLIDHHQFGYPERTSFFLPMHPFHLALWSLVSRSAVWLGFSSVALSTTSIGLIYALGVRMYGRRAPAVIAAALFATLPMFVLFSPVLATEHLFIVLMLSSMLTLVGVTDGSRASVVVAGVFAGLAVLTRGEGVFYLPALVLFLWMGSSASGVRPKMRATLLLGIGVALIVTPWYVRNAVIASPDTGLSTGAGINFYFAHNDSDVYGWYPSGSPLDGLSSEEANRLGWELGLAYLRENPARLIRDIGFGTKELFGTPEYALYWSTRGLAPGGDPVDPTSFTETHIESRWAFEFVLGLPVLLVLGVAALFAFRTWPRRILWLVVPLILSSWVLRTVLYWAKPRYGYFLHVMLVFIAALALMPIIDANRRASRRAVGATVRAPAAD